MTLDTRKPQDVAVPAYQLAEQESDFDAPTVPGRVRLFAKAAGLFFRRFGQAAVKLLSESDLTNLTFPAGARILGNFYDTVRANRVIFQSDIENQTTALGVMPSGSGLLGAYVAYGVSDPDNAPFINVRCTNVVAQILADKSGSAAFVPLGIWVGGIEAIRVNTNGRVGIGTNAPTALLDINSDTARLRTPRTPASATAPGNPGDICWDANFIYTCVATNTWKRAPLASW